MEGGACLQRERGVGELVGGGRGRNSHHVQLVIEPNLDGPSLGVQCEPLFGN